MTRPIIIRRAATTIKALSLALTMSIGIYSVSWYESHYTREAKVIKVSNDIITVKDKTNNIWKFFGNDYSVNDKVRLTIDTNHTDTDIHDDKISNVSIIN